MMLFCSLTLPFTLLFVGFLPFLIAVAFNKPVELNWFHWKTTYMISKRVKKKKKKVDCYSSEASKMCISYSTASWEVRNDVWCALKTPICPQYGQRDYSTLALFSKLSVHLTLLNANVNDVTPMQSKLQVCVLFLTCYGLKWSTTPTTVKSGHAHKKGW